MGRTPVDRRERSYFAGWVIDPHPRLPVEVLRGRDTPAGIVVTAERASLRCNVLPARSPSWATVPHRLLVPGYARTGDVVPPRGVASVEREGCGWETTGRTACGGDARPREGKESLSPNEDRRRDRIPAASDRGKPEVHTQRVELVFCFVQYSQAMVTYENRGSSSRTATTVCSSDRPGARSRPARVPRASRVAATRAIPARTTRNRSPAPGTAPIVERARSDTGRR